MRANLVAGAALVLGITGAGWCQTQSANSRPAPIYHVNVVERTVNAVNYQYRSAPTPIDFRGTVLMPEARGSAIVQSKPGRTDVDAHFEHLAAPTRYGAQSLTYVLWAVTPEGNPKNLGEVLVNGSDKSHLHVTTDLQAFGLIVTAEPHAAVRQPSDVVVVENEIRPDTVGKIEPIRARFELLPRGTYTYVVPRGGSAAPDSARVSYSEYQSLLAIYEAQNAVQIARAANADQFAGETFARAEQLLNQARQMQAGKAGMKDVVTTAREAAQTAEDARQIALKREQDQQLAQAREQARHAQAEAAVRQADAATAADRAARQQAQADREAADVHKPSARAQLRQWLSTVAPTTESPRGLIVTLPDTAFESDRLRTSFYDTFARVAAIVRSQPGLKTEVDSYSDGTVGMRRAETVRRELVRNGISGSVIPARTYSSNGAPGRVEIVISGEPIAE